jgi:hypothetical protein
MTPDRRRRAFLLGFAGSLLASGPLFAKALPNAKDMKPGEFVWRPQLSPTGPVVVVVSLPLQIVHVYRNGIVIGVSTCSTGKRGHSTPTGVFTILQKRAEHYSSTYNNAPMPNMQRLTWRGIALHAGQLPGYPASHGCIRLPLEFSEVLFSVTGLGTSVIIADHTSVHNSVVEPSVLLSPDASAAASEATAKAAQQPTKRTKTTGALSQSTSILVSAADRKAYLIVDGVVTAETPIDIFDSGKPLGTHLYSLIGPSADGHALKWNLFDIDGDPQSSTEVDVWSDRTLARIEYLDGPAVRAIGKKLLPGTTMVITDTSAGADTRTGPDFTIIAEDKTLRGKRVGG